MDGFKFSKEFDKELSDFRLLSSANKITYEFAVKADEKDKFFYWINILSSIEFKVDVDLNNIMVQTRKRWDYVDSLLFRIKVSGLEDDLYRWNDNLKCIAKFLNGDYDITYIGEKEGNSN